MKKNTLKNLLFTTIIGVTVSACSSTTTYTPQYPYDKGVFVLNQGNFLSNNGSITWVSKDTPAQVAYDIFQTVNSRSLAGGVTDYTETNSKGVILVDNSAPGKDLIEIVDAHTFKSAASVTSGIENPRHVVPVSTSKVYVSCWDSFNSDYSYKPGYVAVVDLATNKVLKKIPVQEGAEEMVVVGNEAYLGNVYTDKSYLTVIDLTTDAVKMTIEVGANPQGLIVDANNSIWLQAGNQILKLNTTTKTVDKKLSFAANSLRTASKLTFNKDKTKVFFTYYYSDVMDNYKTKGEVYTFNTSDSSIGVNKYLINRVFTGFGYDSEKDLIYGAVTPSYTQAGYVLRFKTDGTRVDSVKTEIAPSGFFFK